MGGGLLMRVGGIVVGVMTKWLEWVYEVGKGEGNGYKGGILESLWLGGMLNMMVVGGEGVDWFV